MTIKVTPTCRYGHGDLVKINHPEAETDQFLIPAQQPMRMMHSPNGPVVHPAGFVFHIYKCPKCTYMELHDTEEGA